MNYRCKRNYFNGFYLVFQKDKWYKGEVQYDKDEVNQMVVMKYPVNEPYVNGNAEWLVLPDMFDDHFYTEQEARELEINKVLEL
tara:strand:- start:3202 stop:3453 length:252 start_codon:yes stop_codon:yes gene_type:complete